MAAAIEKEELSVDDAQHFLKVLFDPSQDLEAAVLDAIRSMSPKNAALKLANGVKLGRKLAVERDDRGRAEWRPPDSHRAYPFAKNIAVKEGMTLIDRRVVDKWDRERVVVHATAQVGGLAISEAREPGSAPANDRAAHNAMEFFSDLVALRAPEQFVDSTPASRWSGRKPPLHEMPIEVPAQRPKRDLSESARDVIAEDRADKAEAEAYRRLVKGMFTSREAILQQLDTLKWFNDLQATKIDIAESLTVEQRVGKKVDRVICELRVLDGNMSFTGENEELEIAARGVTRKVRVWLEQLRNDSLRLSDTYELILKKKPDYELSASTDTRSHARVKGLVNEQTTSRGALHECIIRVRGQIAIRRWAVKTKNAKRAANTDFHDLVKWILQSGRA